MLSLLPRVGLTSCSGALRTAFVLRAAAAPADLRNRLASAPTARRHRLATASSLPLAQRACRLASTSASVVDPPGAAAAISIPFGEPAATWPHRPCDRISPIPPRSAAHVPLCSPDDPVQLQYLPDCTESVRQAALTQMWLEWPEFYRAEGCNSAEDVIALISREFAARDALNLCLVGTIDGEFACTASLATTDVPAGHPWHGLKPWLISVTTAPKYRGRRLSTILMRAVERRAQLMGYRHIFLMTMDLQRYYGSLGYNSIETTPVIDHLYTLMRRDFSDESGQTIPRFTIQDAQEHAARLKAATSASADAPR